MRPFQEQNKSDRNVSLKKQINNHFI